MERNIRQLFNLRNQNLPQYPSLSYALSISFPDKPRPVGQYIQISARGVARGRSPNLNTKPLKISIGFFLSELLYHLIPQRQLANLQLIPRGRVIRRLRLKRAPRGRKRFLAIFLLWENLLPNSSSRSGTEHSVEELRML